jgi:hypothetical protein
VTPGSFDTFFGASAGVAGALVGLLFVAMSVASERFQGEEGDRVHQIRALAAFTAFTNALGVSLVAVIPDVEVGWAAILLGLVAASLSVASILALTPIRHSEPDRDTHFLLGPALVYVAQVGVGIWLVAAPHSEPPVGVLCIGVVFCFLAGISRAWEVIGGPSVGLFAELRSALSRRD